MHAHVDAAQRRQHKADHQGRVDQSLHDPERRVLSLKECSVPFPVQDLMQDHQHRHGDARPLVPGFTCHLIAHQQQESDAQQDICNMLEML